MSIEVMYYYDAETVNQRNRINTISSFEYNVNDFKG